MSQWAPSDHLSACCHTWFRLNIPGSDHFREFFHLTQEEITGNNRTASVMDHVQFAKQFTEREFSEIYGQHFAITENVGIHASPSPQRTAKAQPSTKRGELAPVHPLSLTQRGPVNCALREGALWASTVMRRLGAPARAGVTPRPAFSPDHVTCGCSGQAEPQLCPLKWAERTSSQAAEEMWGDVPKRSHACAPATV